MKPERPFARHQLALRIAERLRRESRVRAIALTGSIARGDSEPGSDIDLWVLGDRNRRFGSRVANTPVSCLWQTPKQSLTLDTLVLFEVEDAWVLYDPEGLFRQVRAAYWRNRQTVRESILRDTAMVIHELVMEAASLNPTGAIAHLREAARRFACLFIFAARGWRVPQMRHFARYLPAGARSHLLAILGLPEPVAVTRLVRFVRGHRRQLAAWHWPRRLYPPALPTASHLAWMASRGRGDDLVLLVRHVLIDLPRRRRVDSAGRELWALAHGFAPDPPDHRTVRRLARRVSRLLASLKLGGVIDARWRFAEHLARLAR